MTSKASMAYAADGAILLNHDRPDKDGPKTRRMLRYWGVTLTLYGLCIALLWFETARGAANRTQAIWLTAFALGGEGIGLILICASSRLGLALGRVAKIQGIHAILAIVGAYACVGAVRGGTLLLLLVVLVFCSFTLKLRDSRFISGFAVGLLGITMAWLVHVDPVGHRLADEAVYFVLASSMLAAVTFLTGQFDYLRKRLQAEKAELQQALVKINLLATSDELTQLPNRRYMNQVLSREGALGPAPMRSLCFILIDIDDFKKINDKYGHGVGDAVLHAFAAQIRRFLRDTDIVARWGGEEFLVLLKDTDQARAEQILMRMQDQPFDIAPDGLPHRLAITFSAGIALATGGEPLSETIIHADRAMFQAKAAGRNTYRVFDPDLEAERCAREQWKADLRHAIDANQLVLHYQPQLSAAGAITGVEALVRWLHPVRGLIGPQEFIAEAERTGLIDALGQWVLQAGCQQLRVWDVDAATRHLSMAVNVSAKQLHGADFVAQVVSVIEATGIDPHRLKLELTESMLISNLDDTVLKMRTLQAVGVRFSLDDFGTGYSSLAYLKRLPLNQLKIDQSFVRDMLDDPHDAAIVATIISLARSFGLSVIAEGVETLPQCEMITAQGCEHYQGYLFSKPLPIAELDAYLHAARQKTG